MVLRFEPPKSNKNDQDDLYLKEYKKARKKSMIVSNCLDDDLKLHLEHLKYGDFSTKASRDKGRRHSMIDFELIERLKKASSHHFGLNEENEDDLSNTSGSNEFQSSSKEEYLNEMKSKTPGFASHLSKEGQYALLKSLEDTITTEIEINHPELRDKITRTSTAKYGRRGSKSLLLLLCFKKINSKENSNFIGFYFNYFKHLISNPHLRLLVIVNTFK